MIFENSQISFDNYLDFINSRTKAKKGEPRAICFEI